MDNKEKNKGPDGITNYGFLKEYPKVLHYAVSRRRNKDILLRNKSRK